MKFFTNVPFLRFMVLQSIVVAGACVLYLQGTLMKPFQTDAKWFVIIVLCLAAIGLYHVAKNKLETASWIAAILVRVGIVGTIIGLISATSALVSVLGGQNISVILADFMGRIGIAFYVSLAALGSNLWLELSIKLADGSEK
jgi:hypothetical protein